jgi:hypothetical protein
MRPEDLTLTELATIVRESHVLRIMGEQQIDKLTVDYVPARAAMILPRLDGDEPVNPNPPQVISITFILETAMFGGVIYAALVCGHRVVINPFMWIDYAHLTQASVAHR